MSSSPSPSRSASRSAPHAAPLGRRALVIGASMAGLLTARVLADHFQEVWLLERDALPQGPKARKGTPQATHSHGLLARGREVMEQLLPGMTDALLARGAATGDLGSDGIFSAGGRRFVRAEAGVAGLAVSRLALEAEVRRRVLDLPAVHLHTGIDVHALTTSPAGDAVTGVRLTRRATQRLATDAATDAAMDAPSPSPTGSHEEIVTADLVVDASGRASRTPRWLQALGYPAPDEERVGEGLPMAYATAQFERAPTPDGKPPFGAVICAVTPASPRGGVLLYQEPDEHGRERWTISLGGYGDDRPEPSLAGMQAFARRIGCPELIDVLHNAPLIGEVSRYQFAHSQRRHFERLSRFPQRYLVVGDAIASFNPIYGQGMTVAACEALAMRHALAQGLDAGLYRRYFKAASRVIDTPWQTAVGSDLALDFVPGKRTLGARIINAYVARIQIAAQHDAKVAHAFVRVGHLLKPPASLFAPGMLLRVLWGSLRHRPAAQTAGGRQAQGTRVATS